MYCNSPIKRILFYYRHVYILVFFYVLVCSLSLRCMLNKSSALLVKASHDTFVTVIIVCRTSRQPNKSSRFLIHASLARYPDGGWQIAPPCSSCSARLSWEACSSAPRPSTRQAVCCASAPGAWPPSCYWCCSSSPCSGPWPWVSATVCVSRAYCGRRLGENLTTTRRGRKATRSTTGSGLTWTEVMS